MRLVFFNLKTHYLQKKRKTKHFLYTSTDCDFKNTLRKIRLNINYRNNKCMLAISDVK